MVFPFLKREQQKINIRFHIIIWQRTGLNLSTYLVSYLILHLTVIWRRYICAPFSCKVDRDSYRYAKENGLQSLVWCNLRLGCSDLCHPLSVLVGCKVWRRQVLPTALLFLCNYNYDLVETITRMIEPLLEWWETQIWFKNIVRTSTRMDILCY